MVSPGGGGPTYDGFLMHAVFENLQPMLIVRSPVLEFWRAYVETPAADNKFLRIGLYICTYRRYTEFSVYKLVLTVRIYHVKNLRYF